MPVVCACLVLSSVTNVSGRILLADAPKSLWTNSAGRKMGGTVARVLWPDRTECSCTSHEAHVEIEVHFVEDVRRDSYTLKLRSSCERLLLRSLDRATAFQPAFAPGAVTFLRCTTRHR